MYYAVLPPNILHKTNIVYEYMIYTSAAYNHIQVVPDLFTICNISEK